MAIIPANITTGATDRSEVVTVAAAVANGTTVVVYRGEFLIGSGVVTTGIASVSVPPLSIGDIIQASVTERGNQAGIPVRVIADALAASGWLEPLTVKVTGQDGTTTVVSADVYESTYGETPGAVYDPLAGGQTRLPDDYDKAPTVELGFDLSIIQQAGSTSVRVIPRNGEGLLVGWNGAAPSSPAPLNLLASANVSIAVVRDNDPTKTITRTIGITVLPAPTSPSTPAAGDIMAAGYQLMGNGFIRARINSNKPCEAQLEGYSTDWKPGISYGPQYQEVDWPGPVPSGIYTVHCRVIGETNVANYTNFIITF